MRSLVPYTKQASRQDIPTTTCSNVFFLEQADLKVDLNYPGLPKPRTEKMLMIEVLVSSGTDTDRKTRLLAALVEALDGERASPLNELGPRSDDQWAIRARERAAESLDGTLISLGGNSSLS
jgi:hypothetical protein